MDELFFWSLVIPSMVAIALIASNILVWRNPFVFPPSQPHTDGVSEQDSEMMPQATYPSQRLDED